MTSADLKNQLSKQLPDRVVDTLFSLAEKYQKEGIDIVLFGSFARNKNRGNSDIDLAFWSSAETPAKLKRELRNEMENLPTIRSVDLVDVDEIDGTLIEEIKREGIPLCDETTEFTTNT